ncbi:Crp/Fnr family transcriptional regulator [Jannaschia formosa]|uniref:Crp/Fnr family transcriptional regulator n=1 Tax=Jannaschia formosa TaxID=2259592 RepID=UPI0010753651|nr:Crp/Fnr family transcriptional regulator [Jannaschia formosa]TFL16071.1 Crp/Fnr family transcriptional regulator [Jannaschia formosa]
MAGREMTENGIDLRTAAEEPERRPGGSPFLGLFLRRRSDLTDEALEALASIPVERRVFGDGETIVAYGPTLRRSCLLIRGTALRNHPDKGGLTGISAICLPGDFMDLHAYPLADLDHDIVAVGRSVVEFVEHDDLDALILRHPRIGLALWRETLVDAQIHRTWVIASSNLQASQRIAHLLCEMEFRLRRVGLADGGHFTTSLDQKTVAAILGLSAVHVNRAVQELRTTGLLVWTRQSVHLPNLAEIRDFARFDSTYLDG